MKLRLYALLLLAVIATSSTLLGQGITSSGITGRVTDNNGEAVSDISVTIVFEPTGHKSTTKTNSTGRYNVRGLRVGGPYTITMRGGSWEPRIQKDVFIELSRTYSANFSTTTSLGDVIDLDEFTILSGSDFWAASAAGSGTVVNSDTLTNTPNINRSFADIARLDPRVSISDGSSGAGQIVALGQNHRTNNIQIDGVKINDQFGLEATGDPSHANAISMDTIEEISVDLTPYDVRQSGFLGASINAVTKSGANDFFGSTYYFFENENMRGNNPITGAEDPFDETTWGATFGGPILKNKLFFFLAYEELERNTAGPTPGFFPSQNVIDTVQDFMISEYGFDPGTFGSEGKIPTSDKKMLAKIDWTINDNHRASLRWNKTEGSRPDFTEYDDYSSSSPETNLSSHWFSDQRTNESWVFQLFSNWSDDFQTEFRFGQSEFTKLPFNSNVFPEIIIDNVEGTTRNGEFTDRGELYFGRDDSRHSNFLSTEVTNIALTANWFKEDHTISFGFDYEKSDFFNLFLQETFAQIEFEGMAGFLADEIDYFDKALGIEGNPIAAESDFADLGLFIQDSWAYDDKLTLNFGLRFDTISAKKSPTLNPGRNGKTFEELFAIDNTNTVDGSELLAPRISFSYMSDELTQIRGGIGLFQGRSPWVWVSNSFSNNGVSSTDIFVPPSGYNRVDGGGLQGYLANDFDPENPVTYVTPEEAVSGGRSQVDVLQDNFRIPSIWKANIAIDRRLSKDSPWMAWSELIFTDTQTSLWTQDLNVLQVGTAPDGRNLYNGQPRTGDGAIPEYSNIYKLSNSGGGDSVNFTLGVRKDLRNNWWLDASYNYGDGDDVSNQGSSTASSNYAGNPIYNQNTDVPYTGYYVTEHRVLVRAGYNLDWSHGLQTRFSLTYDGSSGQNYSLLFANDYNNDGAAYDNDLFWVPDGINDPIIDLENSNNVEEMIAFLDSIGAKPGLASRNGFQTSWRNRWDISIQQDLPTGDRIKTQLFLNLLNVANLLDSNSGLVDEVPFQTMTIADGNITNNGSTIAYDFFSTPSKSIRTGNYANLSRWRAQVGLKVNF